LDGETNIVTLNKTATYEDLVQTIHDAYGSRRDIVSIEKNGKSIQTGLNVPVDMAPLLHSSAKSHKKAGTIKVHLQIPAVTQPVWRDDQYDAISN
jgi:hypothetical protein